MASIVGKALRGFGRALKSFKGKKSNVNLKEIHDKYFDKSGMKHKGYDIFREGIKVLENKK